MTGHIKTIAYSAIVVFSVLFMVMVGVFVINPKQKLLEYREKEAQRKMEQLRKQADSIVKEVKVKDDSLRIVLLKDSISHAKEKKKIEKVYIKKINEYETLLNNTLVSDSELGTFSIREMLSDSSVSVW